MKITINDVQKQIEEYLKAHVKISGAYDLFGKNQTVSPVGDADSGLDIIPKIEVMVRTLSIHRKKRGEHTHYKTYHETVNNYLEQKVELPIKVNFGIILYASSNEQMNEMLYEMITIPDRSVLTVNGYNIDFQLDFIANQKLKELDDIYRAEFMMVCMWDVDQIKGQLQKKEKIEEVVIEDTHQLDEL